MLGTGLPDGDVEIEKQSFLPSGSPWPVLWEGGYLQPTLQAGVGWGGTLSSMHFSLNSRRPKSMVHPCHIMCPMA